MSLVGCLIKARGVTAGGKTSAVDAVYLMADNGKEAADAFELLEECACPATAALNRIAKNPPADMATGELIEMAQASLNEPQGLYDWMDKPNRKPGEILSLFDRALLRAKQGAAA